VPTWVNEPQEPENTWILGPAALKLIPTLFKVIVGYADLATKLYQTSEDPIFPQAGKPAVAVALIKVPNILLQVVLLVSRIAPEQRSFAGGTKPLVTHMSKLATEPGAEILAGKATRT
jgi:hypothetical protein